MELITMNSRKGYLHAIEGVIASLLVLTYLSSIVTSPAPTDWSKTSLSKRSGDTLNMLSRTDVLDRAIMQNRPETIGATLEAMGLDMGYSMKVNGVPQRSAEISLIMKSSEIRRSGTMSSSIPNGANGLPSSESGYREGTIKGVDFVLSDLQSDGKTKYNAVNFDFDSDGDYSTSQEGPYLNKEQLNWCMNASNCRDDIHQVGYINDTLTVYELQPYSKLIYSGRDVTVNTLEIDMDFTALDFAPEIEQEGSAFTQTGSGWETQANFDGYNVDLRVSNSNSTLWVTENDDEEGPYQSGDTAVILGTIYTVESVMPLDLDPENSIPSDVVLAKGIGQDQITANNRTLKRFLLKGRTVMEMKDLVGYNQTSFRDTFQHDMGLQWSDMAIEDTGPNYNRFKEDIDPGTPPEFIKDYSQNMNVDIPRERYTVFPAGSPSYAWANISLSGKQYTVNASLTTDEVSISGSPGATIWYEDGDRFSLEGNIYEIRNTHPLTLTMQEPHYFQDLKGGNILGGKPILIDQGSRWNLSSSSVKITSYNSGDGGISGLPDTDCTPGYKNSDFVLDGTVYTAVLTDIPPCGTANEYVNFDYNANGEADDGRNETDPGYAEEGFYQHEESTEIDFKEYNVLVEDGEDLHLRRDVSEQVSTAMWLSEAHRGNGNFIHMGNVDLNDDDLAVVKAILLRSIVNRYRMTPQKLPSDPAVGQVHTNVVHNDITIPYTVESIWWFQ